MTFTDILNLVQERLNLTSASSTTRIGQEINDWHRRVTSSCQINLSRRATVQQAITIGSAQFTFTNVEKVINLVDRSTSPYRVLQEVTIEFLRNRQPYVNSFAQYWAPVGFGTSTVTIECDCVFTAALNLFADVFTNTATLSGTQTPLFPESFHDILVHGVLSDEYRKMEKKALALDEMAQAQDRLGDLRLHLAMTAYKDMVQGGMSADNLPETGVPGAGGSGNSGVAVPISALFGTPLRLVGLDGGGLGVATLANDALIDPAAAIQISKLANGSPLSVLCNPTNAGAAHVDLQAFQSGQVLKRTLAGTLAFQPPLNQQLNADTGTLNNWLPTALDSSWTSFEWSGASDATVTGIAGGTQGMLVTVKNIGTHVMYFAHGSGSSSAGNRLLNTVSSGLTPIGPGGWITYQYDGSTWVLVGHVQGAAFLFTPAITFGGGNTGITYGTQTARAILTGNVLYVHGRITLTSKGSSTGSALITGTPYTWSSGDSGGYVSFCGSFSALSGGPITFIIAAGGSTAQFITTGTTGSTGLVDTNFTNTSDTEFTLLGEVT